MTTPDVEEVTQFLVRHIRRRTRLVSDREKKKERKRNRINIVEIFAITVGLQYGNMALPRHRLLLLTAHCHSYKPSLPCTSSIKCTSARYSFSTDSNQDDDNKHSLAGPMHSLLRSRRTATRLVHSLDDSKRQQEQDYIAQALNRAVACAQMAPNHKRTEPFSFKKIMASSQSAQTLAEISYQITLNKSSSSSSQPVAERKRQKWLEIPAFLVALIHDNQDPSSLVTCDNEAFQELPFMPPKTERQLEDVSSIFFFFYVVFRLWFYYFLSKKKSYLIWNPILS